MGVIPKFDGVLCHDHHLRELERAFEQVGQQWAKSRKDLPNEINRAVNDAGGCLAPEVSATYRKKYRSLLDGAQVECPPPDDNRRKGSRGRMKRSKARNLLERLIDYEKETLRFMDDPNVPSTNNQGENDSSFRTIRKIGFVSGKMYGSFFGRLWIIPKKQNRRDPGKRKTENS
ncbi:MAG: transposase [Proteobacteria bacterium]|nr:transposase [Pseudomonadota bacterium]